MPLSDKCSSEPQKVFVVGNEVCDESSIVGLPNQTPSEAHEITSPLLRAIYGSPGKQKSPIMRTTKN